MPLTVAESATPEVYAQAWSQLQDLLEQRGRDPAGFPNGLGTMWFYISNDDDEAERILQERVVPTIHRPEETLRDRLPIGRPQRFVEKIESFRLAGVQRVFVWPVADDIEQLERFVAEVVPHIG